MLTIKRLTSEDIPAARRLSDAANWNQLDVDWERVIALWPETTLGGFLDGQLVATSSLAIFKALPGQEMGLGWIGMVLVDPAHRGAGHGGAIFDAVMRSGAERGVMAYGLDATDMGRPLYAKRGFTERLVINRWQCESPKKGGGMGRKLFEWECGQIMPLDAGAAQTHRVELLRRLIGEAGVQVRVAKRETKVAGYGMLRPGRVAAYIGPVVAKDAETAGGILRGLLSEVNGAGVKVFIDVPANSPLEGALKGAGFTVARSLYRMGKGAEGHPLAYTEQVYAIAGLELC